jgi:cytochrome c553
MLTIALVALFMPLVLSQAETAFEKQLGLCTKCHGTDANSTTAGIPSLAGQPETFLVTQLIYFREGLRTSEQMAPQAAKLDDTTIEALAAPRCHASGVSARTIYGRPSWLIETACGAERTPP